MYLTASLRLEICNFFSPREFGRQVFSSSVALYSWTEGLIIQENGSIFSHYFPIPFCDGLPVAKWEFQKHTAWFHEDKVDKLGLTDNTVPHDPTLKMTQIFWLFGPHHSERSSHSICSDSPSGPESIKVFQEVTGDEKNALQNNLLTSQPLLLYPKHPTPWLFLDKALQTMHLFLTFSSVKTKCCLELLHMLKLLATLFYQNFPSLSSQSTSIPFRSRITFLT